MNVPRVSRLPYRPIRIPRSFGAWLMVGEQGPEIAVHIDPKYISRIDGWYVHGPGE